MTLADMHSFSLVQALLLPLLVHLAVVLLLVVFLVRHFVSSAL